MLSIFSMIKFLIPAILLAITSPLFAQTNVRAWYADGQVWVVWEVGAPLPDWYEIYAKPTSFTSVDNATGVGKLHKLEYTCAALKEQIDTSTTPRIPAQSGPGKYQLAANEALFVFTPHEAGSLYFAVVAEGETTVTSGQNITVSAAPFQFNPASDPVECHLQAMFPSPFANGFICFAFMMWADGRQNQWENRPIFPSRRTLQKRDAKPFLYFSSRWIGYRAAIPNVCLAARRRQYSPSGVGR
ncbi:MAG: hypothetical protein IPJ00_16790 [Saprospirales bacterium]|nr:hypothetical protein [Saprospirales bacterium]